MEGIQRFRYNVMGMSDIQAFAHVKGGINQDCKDVYFIRAVGVNDTFLRDIAQMDQNLTEQMNGGRGYYNRPDSLPKAMSAEDTAFYSACYDYWMDHNRKEAETKATRGSAELKGMLGNACGKVEDIFSQSTGSATPSMRKNLIVKMLYWYDFVFSDEKFHWDRKLSSKIVFSNIEKKHEYLFCYLVTLMGCDVLLLQSAKDIGAAEDGLQLSQKLVLGNQADIEIPPYVRSSIQAMEKPGAAGSPPQSAASPARPQADMASTAQPTAGLPRASLARPAQQSGASPASPAQPTAGLPRASLARPAQQSPARPPQTASARMEKSFEELAQLASSVVMIGIHDQRGEVIGSGSGIMVGRDGYILTNNHVAHGGRFYSVRIEDDEQVYQTDEMIKYHSVLDLALIRIDRHLNPLPIYQGRDKLVRGQKVVAIGSPLGLFNSVSDGIISGFRTINAVDMIQFTAPISHGSSGGAVLNMFGEVIGISTAGFDNGQNINLAMGYECINMFINGFV